MMYAHVEVRSITLELIEGMSFTYFVNCAKCNNTIVGGTLREDVKEYEGKRDLYTVGITTETVRVSSCICKK